ncbi:MAG: OpgC domain-containing protein [Acidobacteria bacterium]|nr:OpgC domain-containing protein [Acidobacteriota bacterium]
MKVLEVPTASRPRSTGRIRSLDSLRGLCLMLMTADHAMGPIGLPWATMGFVLIAGITAGVVFERTAERGGTQALFRRCWTRAVQIFLANVTIATVLAVAAIALALVGRGSMTSVQWALAAQRYVESISLFNGFPYAGLLSMYVSLIFGAPFLILILRSVGWPPVLLSGAAIWCLGEATRPEPAWTYNILCWQLPFVWGLAGGYLHMARRWVPRLPIGVPIVAAISLMTIVALRWTWVGFSFPRKPFSQLDFLWIVELALLVTAIQPLAVWYEGRRPQMISSWVERLGRHSLAVFVWAWPITHWLSRLGDHGVQVGWAGKILFGIVAVASLQIPVGFDEMKSRRS